MTTLSDSCELYVFDYAQNSCVITYLEKTFGPYRHYILSWLDQFIHDLGDDLFTALRTGPPADVQQVMDLDESSFDALVFPLKLMVITALMEHGMIVNKQSLAPVYPQLLPHQLAEHQDSFLPLILIRRMDTTLLLKTYSTT